MVKILLQESNSPSGNLAMKRAPVEMTGADFLNVAETRETLSLPETILEFYLV
jgi:hypothetical protein